MEQTSIYNLNQWVEDDRIQREDFNADNAKIEAALLQHASALAAAGNCKIVTGSYKGTNAYGSGGKSSLTFNTTPVLLFIAGDGYGAFMVKNATGGVGFETSSTSAYSLSVTWGSTGTVSWYGNSYSRQLNTSGQTYY